MGGIFGGVVAIISTVTFVWICRRRRSQPRVADYPTSTSESIIHNAQAGPIAQEQAPMLPSASVLRFPADTGSPQSTPQIHGCPRLLGIIVRVHLSRIVGYSNLVLLDPESPTPTMSSTVALPSSYLQANQAQSLDTSGFPAPGMQPSFAPRPGSEPDPPDVMTALNVITRMDPSQQRTLVSVLNTLVPSERSPLGVPNSVVRPPYSG